MLVTAGCAMRADLFPLVIVTMFSEHDVADLRALFGAFEQLFQRDERYALVVDVTHLKRPGGHEVRKYVAEWCYANRANTARCNVATSVLGACMLVRGALTAVNWLAPFPTPIHHGRSLGDSVGFCFDKLRAARVELSPAARKFHQRAVDPPSDSFSL